MKIWSILAELVKGDDAMMSALKAEFRETRMIHHYINLVSWRPIPQLYDASRDVVWIDSVSTRILASLFCSGLVYRPGTTVLSKIGPGCDGAGDWFLLPAMKLASQPEASQFVLPFFKEIHVPDDLAEVIRNLEPGIRVGIGISSPKQNILAVALHKIRPDLEYHCLGAALADLDASKSSKPERPPLAGSGFEWLRFLLNSPRRTVPKLTHTVIEFLKISLDLRARSQFRRFVDVCERDEDHSSTIDRRAKPLEAVSKFMID